MPNEWNTWTSFSAKLDKVFHTGPECFPSKEWDSWTSFPAKLENKLGFTQVWNAFHPKNETLGAVFLPSLITKWVFEPESNPGTVQADTCWAVTPLATSAFSAILRRATVSSLYYMYNIIIFLIQKMKYSIYIKKMKKNEGTGCILVCA